MKTEQFAGIQRLRTTQMVQSYTRAKQGAAAFVILCDRDIMGDNFIPNVVTYSVGSVIFYL